MWRENKDVRSNIVEALDERVGGPARNLDATISQCAQKLTILRLWFHDSADTIVTQIEQLQVELVLLALRNWDLLCLSLFDVPTGFYLAN
jgi:argininosuccinate lyase